MDREQIQGEILMLRTRISISTEAREKEELKMMGAGVGWDRRRRSAEEAFQAAVREPNLLLARADEAYEVAVRKPKSLISNAESVYNQELRLIQDGKEKATDAIKESIQRIDMLLDEDQKRIQELVRLEIWQQMRRRRLILRQQSSLNDITNVATSGKIQEKPDLSGPAFATAKTVSTSGFETPAARLSPYAPAGYAPHTLPPKPPAPYGQERNHRSIASYSGYAGKLHQTTPIKLSNKKHAGMTSKQSFQTSSPLRSSPSVPQAANMKRKSSVSREEKPRETAQNFRDAKRRRHPYHGVSQVTAASTEEVEKSKAQSPPVLGFGFAAHYATGNSHRKDMKKEKN